MDRVSMDQSLDQSMDWSMDMSGFLDGAEISYTSYEVFGYLTLTVEVRMMYF